MLNSVGFQGIHDRVDDRRRRSDGARLADALHPQRVMRTRRRRPVELEAHQIVGSRHRVVHQRSGQKLAALVVHRALPECLTDTLRQAAVQLAVNDHRVDDVADVVARQVALELHLPRLLVDLDDRDVGAERIGEIGRIVEGGGLEAGLQILRIVVGEIRHLRHLGQCQAAVGGALD